MTDRGRTATRPILYTISALCALLLSLSVGKHLGFGVAERGREITRAAELVASLSFLSALGLLIGLVARTSRQLGAAALILLAIMATAALAAVTKPGLHGANQRLAVMGDTALWITAVILFVFAAAQTMGRLLWKGRASASARSATRGLQAVVNHWSWLIYLLGVIAAVSIYVGFSWRILSWDPLTYWTKVDQVAALVRHGLSLQDVRHILRSASDEYSLLPAVLPGFLTSIAPDHTLIAYMLAVAVAYVVPASLATGALGYALANRLRSARRLEDAGDKLDMIVIGAVASFMVLPAFFLTYLSGVLLDIGGVFFCVVLTVSWVYFLNLLLDRPARPVGLARDMDVIATALLVAGLSIFVFVFRRWYVFYAVGNAVAAAIFLAASVRSSGRDVRALLRDLALAAASGILLALAWGADIAIQWILQWTQRQYAESYAAYWFGAEAEYVQFVDRFSLIVPIVLLGFVLYVFVRADEKALPALLVGGTALAVGAFLKVQGPSIQHYYILMPLFSSAAAGLAILLARRAGKRIALCAVLLLGFLFVLIPGRSPWLRYLLPAEASIRPPVRPDILELSRLAQWLTANLRSGQHYCVMASNLTLNATLVSNLWQLDRRLLLSPVTSSALWIGDVDTRDGPPDSRILDCSIMVVASPVQTHLAESNQQSVVIPARDLLDGTGIGRAYTRLNEEFDLENSVKVFVFRREREITADEFHDLRDRFLKTKGAESARYIARFGS